MRLLLDQILEEDFKSGLLFLEHLQHYRNTVEEFEDGMAVTGGKLQASKELESYKDHRIVMALAIAALAVKKVDNMKLVFSGSTHLTPDLLRALAEDAGVFINVKSNDNFFAGYGIYSLNSVSAGKKTVKFPGKVTVKDVFTGKVLGRNVDEITLDMKAFNTCVMYAE